MRGLSFENGDGDWEGVKGTLGALAGQQLSRTDADEVGSEIEKLDEGPLCMGQPGCTTVSSTTRY